MTIYELYKYGCNDLRDFAELAIETMTTDIKEAKKLFRLLTKPQKKEIKTELIHLAVFGDSNNRLTCYKLIDILKGS